MVTFFLFFLLVPCSAQFSFNFTSFNPNIHQINYSGDASPSDTVIQLTLNQNDKNMTLSTGRITYFKPMRLWDKVSGSRADFNTHFKFVVNSQTRDFYGDGIVFFLAPVDFPVSEDKDGCGMGLVSGQEIYNSSANPFVAVEFDTFKDPWDPLDDHVGININSMRSVENVTWLNQIPLGVMNEAWIAYNSTVKKLSVDFTGFDDAGRMIKQSLYHVVDLSFVLPDLVSFGFSAATGTLFEIHTLYSWDFNSTVQTNQNSPTPNSSSGMAPVEATPFYQKRNKATKVVVLLGPLAGVCVLISGLGFVWFSSGKEKKNEVGKKEFTGISALHEFDKGTGPKKFSYRELAIATKGFVEEEKLGQGGFGAVYKGFLKEFNSIVAVKRSRGSKQGIKQYASEVKIISQLRHRNLVQLVGWCHEESELLLVYEFMPNGSLDSHLFNEKSVLNWPTRYNIARGLAAALMYLHEEWEQCVLHRDIKSSNVMLDSNFNAKLGDFGLARLVDHAKGSQTTVMAGTMGYMAPECLYSGKSSKETDVYSFGIVALEIACGRKPVIPNGEEEQIRLVDWVWELFGKGRILDSVDAKLDGEFNGKQMECLLIVGLWCAYPDRNFRPSIKQAIQVLDFEAPLPRLPSNVPVAIYPPPPQLHLPRFSPSSSYDFTSY